MDNDDAITERQLAEGLKEAGFELVATRCNAAPIPVHVAWAATMCSPGEAGRRDMLYELDRPDLVTGLNSIWNRMAEDVRLFDAHKRFLLSTILSGGNGLPQWVLVRAVGEPDVAGIGAAKRIFGFKRGYIGFATASVDGRAVVQGTIWQSSDSAGILGLSNSRESPRLRAYISDLLERAVLTEPALSQGAKWLAGATHRPEH